MKWWRGELSSIAMWDIHDLTDLKLERVSSFDLGREELCTKIYQQLLSVQPRKDHIFPWSLLWKNLSHKHSQQNRRNICQVYTASSHVAAQAKHWPGRVRLVNASIIDLKWYRPSRLACSPRNRILLLPSLPCVLPLLISVKVSSSASTSQHARVSYPVLLRCLSKCLC